MIAELKGRRVALVGGAGFIGHNLALQLKAQGADVHVVDSLQVNHLGAFYADMQLSNRSLYLGILQERLDLLSTAGIPIQVVDARDYHLLSKALRQIQPQVIVHLAAVAHANQSNKDPHSTFDHSLRTLENDLDAARILGVERFIYLSSSMIYGNFVTGEVDENTPCEPIGIYGSLKFAGEKMVIAYNQTFGLPYVIVRPSALYGERCVSRRVGQVFIEHAIDGREISVQGDGSDRLDFTYIDDFVQGIMLAITKPEAMGEVFNLTYGSSRSLMQMAEILHTFFPDARIVHKDRDRLMPKRGTLSIDKAKRLLGYEPQFPLEKGFVKYINWYLSRKGMDISDAALVVE